MKLKGLKRTIAAIMALVIVGGAMPSVSGGFLSVKPITASADYETENFSYDSKTGQLTLRGEISYSDYVKDKRSIDKRRVLNVYGFFKCKNY